MRYVGGHKIKVGDKVCLGGDDEGIVVCDIGAMKFSPSYPKREWAYLNEGVIIVFSRLGLIHMKEAESDLELVARSD